jgi:hypothetical protein
MMFFTVVSCQGLLVAFIYLSSVIQAAMNANKYVMQTVGLSRYMEKSHASSAQTESDSPNKRKSSTAGPRRSSAANVPTSHKVKVVPVACSSDASDEGQSQGPPGNPVVMTSVVMQREVADALEADGDIANRSPADSTKGSSDRNRKDPSGSGSGR